MERITTQLKQFLILVLVFAAAPFVALYAYDPLQVFHKHNYSQTYIHGNMRLQAAGLINNYDFDSIILGTSMMKGSSSVLASELFGGTFANLSADGSTIFERSIILDYALRKKKLKKVIVSLDTGLDIHSQKSPRRYPLENFYFLYDKNPLNDFAVYWNDHHLECLRQLSKATDCIGNRRTLQRDPSWFIDITQRNSLISGVDNWVGEGGRGRAVNSRLRRHLGNKDSQEAIDEREKAWRTIFDRDLLALVERHPQVEFLFLFPPYSRFMTSIWMKENPGKYSDYKKIIEYLADKSEQLQNLSVFAFDNLPYTADLNNYRDMRHYNVDMNEDMFRRMAKRDNLIDAKNVRQYIAEIDRLNAAYEYDEELQKVRQAYAK